MRQIIVARGAPIGQHLGVTRCSFAEVNDEANDVAVKYGCLSDAMVDTTAKRMLVLDDYLFEALIDQAGSGEMVGVRYTRTDPRTDAAANAARSTRAFLNMPSLIDGRLPAMFNIAAAVPMIGATTKST